MLAGADQMRNKPVLIDHGLEPLTAEYGIHFCDRLVVDQLGQTPAMHGGIDLVHVRQQREGVARRELIPELRPLTEDGAEIETHPVATAIATTEIVSALINVSIPPRREC